MQLSREPMTGVDLAWLRMERPTNLMTIVIVLTFRGRLKYERLGEVLRTRLLCFARFRQRPVHDVLGSHWQTDPAFDMSHHLCRYALPARASQAHLEAAASELASTALDPAHPLWQMHLIERYRRGSALIARFHHCYADGMALLEVLLSLTDRCEQRATHPTLGVALHQDTTLTDTPWVAAAKAALSRLQTLGQSTLEAASTSLRTLAHPEQALGTAKQVAAAGSELAAMSLLANDPSTPLKGPLGMHKQIAWASPLPLREVKTVAATLGCTINDVLLSCVAGALGAHLASGGHPIHGLCLRALVPVNLRPAGQATTLGNRFGLIFVDLPVGEANPLARLFVVRHHMEQCKHSEQAMASLWLLNALGSLPAAIEQQSVNFFTAKATLVISNVPGPPAALYLAGARIDQQFFWVPPAGTIGLGISLLSYDGRVHCGVMSDANLLSRPQLLAKSFAAEFERLLMLVLLGPWAAGELSRSGSRDFAIPARTV